MHCLNKIYDSFFIGSADYLYRNYSLLAYLFYAHKTICRKKGSWIYIWTHLYHVYAIGSKTLCGFVEKNSQHLWLTLLSSQETKLRSNKPLNLFQDIDKQKVHSELKLYWKQQEFWLDSSVFISFHIHKALEVIWVAKSKHLFQPAVRQGPCSSSQVNSS